MRKTFIVSMLVLLGMIITGGSVYAGDCCSGGVCPMTKAADTSGAKTVEKTKKKTALLYQCPMHPEVTSAKPGNCPKCGMKLLKQSK